MNDDCGDLLICFRYSEPRARRLLLIIGASRGCRVGIYDNAIHTVSCLAKLDHCVLYFLCNYSCSVVLL